MVPERFTIKIKICTKRKHYRIHANTVSLFYLTTVICHFLPHGLA